MADVWMGLILTLALYLSFQVYRKHEERKLIEEQRMLRRCSMEYLKHKHNIEPD